MLKKSTMSFVLALLFVVSCLIPQAVIAADLSAQSSSTASPIKTTVAVVQPPAAPTNVKTSDTLVPTHGSVTVNWTKPVSATYYRVRLYRQNPNGTWSNIKIGSGYYKDYGDVSSATLAGLTWVGTYKFQIMAGNEAGWCRGATFSNVFYVAVPAVSNVKASPVSLKPGGSVTITWNRAAGGTYYRIRLYRQNPNGTWSNIKIGDSYYRDYGIVSTVKLAGLSWIGTYKIQVLWGNASGWSSQVSWSNAFSVNSGTYVDVNLTTQTLVYYVDGVVRLSTPVVTGKPSTPTPQGTFAIYQKARDTYLTGPGYHVMVAYWMPFYGGNGLHDATWQPVFGGTRYLQGYGSHGCVNMPLDKAGQLYNMVSVGTVVKVHQ